MKLLFCLLILCTISTTKAVETVTNGTTFYNTTDNISSSLSSWSSGWGTGNTNDGWNYVGNVAGTGANASGVYLGNGWVITAGHVGAGVFNINGNAYDTTGVSYSDFTNSSTGTSIADLTLFQISTTSTTGTNISLPSLTITSSTPSGKMVMIGYGGGKSWGINTISSIGQIVSVNSFQSIDLYTQYGTYRSGSKNVTNSAVLVGGDSGGGDFVKLASTWQLVGLNEAVSSSNSYFVQLSAYDSQIQSIITTAVPEPTTWALIGLSVIALIGSSLWKNRKRIA